jgi:hypothetical protein
LDSAARLSTAGDATTCARRVCTARALGAGVDIESLIAK